MSRPKVVIFLTLSFIQALNFSPASQTLECRIPGDTHQPSRKLRAALESRNVLECTQYSILHTILRFDRVAENCHQGPINQLAVAADQFFESLQLPTLRLGYQSNVSRVHSCDRGVDDATPLGTVTSRRKRNFIFMQDERGPK